MRNVWSRRREFRATGVTFFDLVREATWKLPSQCVAKIPPPGGKYDVLLEVPEGCEATVREILQRGLEEQFSIRLQFVSETKEVYVLRAPQGRPAALRTPSSDGQPRTSGTTRMSFRNAGIGLLAVDLAQVLGRPVIDDTPLWDSYDFDLAWPAGQSDAEMVADAVRTQLGLTLTREKRKIGLVIDAQ